MNISIDASHFSEKNMSGTHIYLYNLIYNLAQIDSSNNYVLYHKSPISDDFFSKMTQASPNFSKKQLFNKFSWTQLGLARELMGNTPDILFCPWQTIPIFHKKHMQIVSVIHAADEQKWYQLGPTLYSSLFSSRLIAVSRYTKDVLVKKYFIPESKISVVPEGVDTVFFTKRSKSEVIRIKEKYGIKGDYIFFIGTLVARKNIARMLKAFKLLAAKGEHSDLNFVLGGTIPDDQKHLLKLPAKLGISEKVKFLGRVKQTDLPALLSGARFLAYVSLSEGFGLPVLESMACETPVLTSKTGALPEISEGSSYLVDPRNIKEISEGMKFLLNEKNHARLVLLGINQVKKFNWASSAEGVLKVFERLHKK